MMHCRNAVFTIFYSAEFDNQNNFPTLRLIYNIYETSNNNLVLLD